MDILILVIALTTALAVSLLTVQVLQRSTYHHRVVGARLLPGAAAGASAGAISVLRARRTSASLFDMVPISRAARDRVTLQLVRAGVTIRVGEFVALRFLSVALLTVLALVVLSTLGIEARILRFFCIVLAVAAGWSIPHAFVERRRSKRVEQLEKQLPDALTAVVKAMRSGAGLLQALAHAADETPAPLGPELRASLRDLQLGADAEEVFEALKERVGSRDLGIAVTAIAIQRTVGGNLTEILTNVTNTIRERIRLAGEIRVLTSRQHLTAMLTAAIPVFVAGSFLIINRDMGNLLVSTTVGQASIAFALLLELMGIVIIRRLGAIEI
jgi:tight adherence protein B